MLNSIYVSHKGMTGQPVLPYPIEYLGKKFLIEKSSDPIKSPLIELLDGFREKQSVHFYILDRSTPFELLSTHLMSKFLSTPILSDD